MSDPVELQSYVRFQLGELRAGNGDHKFEEMCFHLARRIVTSELLPGTGPVGAGGDQGRDFETFEGASETRISRSRALSKWTI